MEDNGNLPAVKLVHRINNAIEDAREYLTYSEIVGTLEIIKGGMVLEALEAGDEEEEGEEG